MATITPQLFISLPISLPKTAAANKTLFLTPHPCHHHSLHITKNRSSSSSSNTATLAIGSDKLGDFGARDPFPAEIASNFGENVLGTYNTEHKILIPNVAAMSLSQQDCSPISPTQSPISEDDAKQLLRKVVGWRLVNEQGILKLQCLWKLKDFNSGIELINRIYNVVQPTAHFPSILQIALAHPYSQVKAQLFTSSIGGLSMNDFIVAAKIDDIRTSDLVTKKRAWA